MPYTQFESFFKDKTVLVTGHTGFIGSWLTLWLQLLGSNIVGLSLDVPTKPSLFQSLNLKKKIHHNFGDINEIQTLKVLLDKYRPEIIFHLAAQPLVKQSYETPLSTLQTNIMGTANLLESVRDCNSVKTCIMMTSDKCYRNSESFNAYVEDDPLGGNDPYSASKGAAEIIINSYKKSFFDGNDKSQAKISTIRAGNVIGGGDWSSNRIIPDCVQNFSQQKPVKIRQPTAIRPFQYVLEPISGMLYLANKMWNDNSFDESWNIGPLLNDAPPLTISKIVEKVIKNWGDASWEDISTQNSFKESNTLLLNSKKIQNKLNWIPVFNIDKTISETISWYKEYYHQSDEIESYSKNCIEYYVKQAKNMKIKWAYGD
jgi:CDP-glucose 4,6-dehydratase